MPDPSPTVRLRARRRLVAPGWFILSALLVCGLIGWVMVRPDAGPVVITDGLTSADISVATTTTTGVIDVGGSLTVTVARGHDEWVLDASRGNSLATVNRALRSVGG